MCQGSCLGVAVVSPSSSPEKQVLLFLFSGGESEAQKGKLRLRDPQLDKAPMPWLFPPKLAGERSPGGGHRAELQAEGPPHWCLGGSPLSGMGRQSRLAPGMGASWAAGRGGHSPCSAAACGDRSGRTKVSRHSSMVPGLGIGAPSTSHLPVIPGGAGKMRLRERNS